MPGAPNVDFIDIEILGKPLQDNRENVNVGDHASKVCFINHGKSISSENFIDWVDVQGGEFEMGCSWGESSESPVHRVKLDDFRISRYEITVKQFRTFCESTGHPMPPEPDWGWIDNHPIVNVSWADANSFAQWLGCRLPTEAEWEFSARGGNLTQNFQLSGSDRMDEVAWHHGNTPVKTTRPVGKLKSNEIGVYDMTGNCWEWVTDWYHADYYRFSALENPQGSSEGKRRVCRGGSFNSVYWISRNTARGTYEENFKCRDLGFRIAMNSRSD